MTDTLINQAYELEIDRLENYKGKWRHLHFKFDGSSILDMDESFDTEADAQAETDSFMRGFTIEDEMWFDFTNETIAFEDLSHTIQIPIGDT